MSTELSCYEIRYLNLTRAGGLYASTTDLIALGKNILNSTLLSPQKTRMWLKPVTHTASLGNSVGAPWEIYRADSLTNDGRVIDFYTKDGGIGSYGSQLVLVPDFGLVLTILTAGSATDILGALMNHVVKTIIPLVDQSSKDEANQTYAGPYYASNSTINLQVDNGPGLLVTNWTSNGRDILQDYTSLVAPDSDLVSAGRLFPTNLVAGRETAWRLVFYLTTLSGNAAPQASQNFWVQGQCSTWGGIDGYVYGYKAVDEFIITVDESMESAISVHSEGLRTTMMRRKQ